MKEQHQNNQGTPLISVVIPFYNREKFLAETIESVIGQTFTDWELILVDDGSTDRSYEIAAEFVERDPARIKLFAHPAQSNQGASASRNLGFQQSRGSYLTFLDSDDVFSKDTLAAELAAFEKCSAADAVCGTAEVWYSWSDAKADRDRDFLIDLVLESEKLYQPPALLIHNLKARGRKPHFNCTLLKREFLERIGTFEEEFRSVGEDQVLWAKVSLHGKIYIMEKCLAKYRQHSASTCADLLKNGGDIDNWVNFFRWLEDYLKAQNITDEQVWTALNGFKKKQAFERKFKKVKQFYRNLIPLHLRYKLRDQMTRLKKLLARSSHR